MQDTKLKIFFISMIFIGTFCIVKESSAATLHVGSEQTYSTIALAIEASNEGDTIIIHPGTYNEYNLTPKSGTSGAHTVVTWAGITRPIISSAGHVVFRLDGINYVDISHLEIEGGTGNEDGAVVFGSDLQSSNVLIDHCRIIGTTAIAGANSAAIRLQGGSNWTISNCEIIGSTTSEISAIKADGRAHSNVTIANNWIHDCLIGIGYKWGTETDRNIVIEKNFIKTCTNRGIYADQSYLSIRNNVISNAGTGLYVGENGDQDYAGGSYSAIGHNTIHGCNNAIVFGTYAPGCTVSDNILYNQSTIVQNGQSPSLSNNYTSDPQFIDSENDDFALQTESGAVGYGADVSQVGIRNINISGVLGTVLEGNLIVISGFNFGDGPSIYKWSKFNEPHWTSSDLIVEDGEWATYSGSCYETPYISTSSPRNVNDFFARTHQYRKNSCDQSDSLFYYDGSGLTDAYVTFYYRRIHVAGSSLDQSTTNMKTHRITYNAADGTGDNPCAGFTFQNEGYSFAVKIGEAPLQEHPTANGNFNGNIPDSQWVRWEVFYKESSPTGTWTGTVDANVQLSPTGLFLDQLNNMQSIDNSDENYLDSINYWNVKTQEPGSTRHWNDVIFGGYMGFRTPVAGVYDYDRVYYQDFDDVYIADSRARIELGNNADWGNCTKREIQGTIDSWNDSSVAINVNQGSFSDGESAYIFAIDANGEVSEGYPITIGEGNSDTTPPASPSGLAVS